MSDPSRIHEANLAIQNVLSFLKIVRVICVDDAYTEEPSIENVTVAASLMDKESLSQYFPEIEFSAEEDTDILKEKIRRLWAGLDPALRAIRAKQIMASARERDEAGSTDNEYAADLNGLFPENILFELSPRQWEEQKERLLRENSEFRTLFLFDQDFSKSEGGKTDGIKIIETLVSADDSSIICGLLTHTVNHDNRLQKWREMCESSNISPDKFLVIPKQYLEEDPVLFAQSLKWVALLPDFSKLKKKAKEIFADASSAAASRVDEINIYDLEQIVFSISAEEGLWEPDMLFRLHALYHRLEARKLAFAGGELEILAGKMRSLSGIATNTISKPISSSWEIQKEELYELSDHVNLNHLPLELGDIFIRTLPDNSKKFIILLAQPCDLMVRKNGERQPELIHVPVAELVLSSEEPNYSKEMIYFGKKNERWFAKLRKPYQVRICVLDLCVFNKDGVARIDLLGAPSEEIRPPWKNRFSIVSRMIKKILKPLAAFSPLQNERQDTIRLKKDLKSKVISSILNDGFFSGTIAEQEGKEVVEFNCQRVSRLSRSYAYELLLAYTGVLARPAQEKPFGC